MWVQRYTKRSDKIEGQGYIKRDFIIYVTIKGQIRLGQVYNKKSDKVGLKVKIKGQMRLGSRLK